MNNSPKKFVRRYLLQYAAISLAFIALCAVYFILFDESVLSVLIFFVICLLCYRLIIRFSAKKLFSPLYDECDAQKYYDIIYLMPLPLDFLFKIYAEEYMGNYDKMIAMASAHYDASKKLKDKCIALIYLADAYFWLRDRENLAKTIEKFNRLKKDNPKKCKIFTSYKVFDYFQDYLDGEFGRCIATSEENLKKLDKHPKQRRISKTRITFNIAVMCYESGNMERARELFTNIIETTPKLVNFKKLSEKYLSAIETGNSDILAPVILDIDTTLYSQERKAIQKRKCWMILWDAIILVLAGFMLLYSAYELQAVEKMLNQALSDHYEQASVIDYFNLEKDEQFIACLCLVDTTQGVDLTTILTSNDNEETIKHLPFAYNINKAQYNYVAIPATDYFIGYQNSTSPLKGDFYYVIKYTYNNVDYWFGIDYIEKELK